MYKTFITLIALLCYTHLSFAQKDLDALMLAMNKNKFKCEDVSAECMRWFIENYPSGQRDSVGYMLEFWESKCGNIEAVQRTKILFAIDNDAYSDAVVETEILDLIFEYQNLKSDAMSDEEVKGQFNRFTRQLATKNKPRFSEERIEYMWCDFYESGGDAIFYHIQKHRYPDSKVTSAYFQTVESERSKRYFHLGFTAGAWIPTGGFTVFGVHPEVGLLVGFKYKRWSFDMNVNYRFLKTPDDYNVERYEIIEQSRRFNVVNAGFDVGFDLLYLPKHKITILAGAGYEGFNALKRENDLMLGPININTYNIDVGASYTFHLTASYYLGGQIKCHFVDYTMNGSIDYKGVPVTLKFKTGWTIHNWHQTDKLHELRYENL